jgi:hypothetical protein
MTYTMIVTIEDETGSAGYPAIRGLAETEVADMRATVKALQAPGNTVEIQVFAEN